MSVDGLPVLVLVEDSGLEKLVADSEEAAVAHGMMLARHRPRPPLER